MARLTTLRHVAQYLECTDRTVRNYIGQGYFPAYKQPGSRGLLVDLDDVDAAMRRLPARKVRPAYGSYGPRADIRVLPARSVVVVDSVDRS